MLEHQESLRERLLRGGIAPRRVARLLRELDDHCEDLYGAALQRGLRPAQARARAREELGTADNIAQALLARPELRSWSARARTWRWKVM